MFKWFWTIFSLGAPVLSFVLSVPRATRKTLNYTNYCKKVERLGQRKEKAQKPEVNGGPGDGDIYKLQLL